MKQKTLKTVLLACSFALAAVNFGHSGLAFADDSRPGDSEMADGTNPGDGAGEQGDQGEQGEQGEQGKDKDKKDDQGQQGNPGDQGEQGEQGDDAKDQDKKDDQGQQGNPGDQGEQGEQANPGDQGEQGEQANPGDQGEQGEQGNPGDQGNVEDKDQGEAKPDEVSPQENQALIPTELTTIKNLGKEAFDQAVNQNITELTTSAESIRTNWKEVRRAAIRKGVPYRTVREMDHQTRRLVRLVKKEGMDHFVLARRVNKINRLLPTVFGVYKSNIPTQILTLNYLSRELILDGHQKMDRSAKRHLRRATRALKHLHPKLMRVNGETESTNLSSKITDMEKAIQDKNHDDISRIGQESIDVLNRMEELF